MARGKPIELATLTFDNQKRATEFFKAMLNHYKPGQIVEKEDSLHLASLLERHSEYAQKIGCGIDHFEVMMTKQSTQCFRICRVDGSGTDFSYGHCITGRPPARKQEVSQAFRQVIRIDLYRAQDKFFVEHQDADGLVSCAVTGERISKDQGHLDHRPPMTFEVLVSTFLQGKGLNYEAVPITNGEDEQTTPEITDENLSEQFRQYHGDLAKLDFVTIKINLAQSAKHRIKPGRIKIDEKR